MKNRGRVILSLAVVITCAVLGLAQETSPTSQRVFTPNGKIEAGYDPLKNVTTVRLNPTQIHG